MSLGARRLLAGLFVLAAICVLGGVLYTMRPRDRVRIAPPLTEPSIQRHESQQGDVGLIRRGLDESEQIDALIALDDSTRHAIDAMNDGGSTAARQDLEEGVLRAVRLFYMSSPSEIFQTLFEDGLPLPEQLDTPEEYEEHWAARGDLFRRGYLDPESVVARHAVVAGQDQYYDVNLGRSSSGGSGELLLGNPTMMGLDVVEFVFNARMGAYKGPEFDGKVGFWFAYDEQRRKWVLNTIAVYGTPDGYAPVVPFF